MFTGHRRMEAENYLASGFGTRIAIESKTAGWTRLSEVARTWQPSRLKGIQVRPEYGTPFLAATQVYDVRPVPRKWLSLDKTDNVVNRFVSPGTILLTCSGSVGRATLAHSTIDGILVSHDLLRIEAKDADWWGWVYAYLRAPTVREMMKAAQYGHIIKHLEVSHLEALPIIQVSEGQRKQFVQSARAIVDMRNEAHQLTLEAERRFEVDFGNFSVEDFGENGFVGRASRLFATSRRRLDAWHHNPSVAAIEQHLDERATGWSSLAELGFTVWLPTRFKRIAAEDGVWFLDSSDLFEINPDITKRIADRDFGGPHNARVQDGWLLLARSGQIYGLNGSAMIAGECHQDKIVSDHIIRIAPKNPRCRVGYLLVAMTHPTLGRPRVKALPYGSSIPEIEVADVEALMIPRLSVTEENEIADCAEKAAKLRNEADELETLLGEEAEAIITDFLSSTSS